MTLNWHQLSSVDFEQLANTREQCHQAIQNVSAVARSFLPQEDGDKNGSLEWVPDLQRLAGHWVPAREKFRSSLDFTDFSVHLVNQQYQSISKFGINGQKQGHIMVWLEEQLASLGLNATSITLNYPYEIPHYPQAKKQPFSVDITLVHELGHYFHNARLAISSFTGELRGFSPITAWPHHFDIASLVTLKDTGSPDTSASINIGLSPGDEVFNEPYFYISPWPYPDEEELAPLRNGEWYIGNFVAAILRANEVLEQKSGKKQMEIVSSFIKDAYSIAHRTIK